MKQISMSKKGIGMYTFVYGQGKKRVSITRHFKPADAKKFNDSLPTK